MEDFFLDIQNDLSNGEAELAVAKCKAFLQTAPDSGQIHAELARSLFRLARHEEAAEAAQVAISINPELSLPHAILGHSQLQGQQIAEAERSFLRALELNPQDAVSHYYLGEVYLSQRRPAEASSQFEQAITINPNDAAFHIRLAMAYLATERWKESIPELVTAFRLNHRLPILYHLIAVVPLAGLVQFRPLVRAVLLLLLHVPLLAPLPMSIPYWVTGEVYFVWLAFLSLRNLPATPRLSLTGMVVWWTLAPWLFLAAHKLVAPLWM